MNGPARFAVRHPVVEAIQWTGDNEDVVRAFAGQFEAVDPAYPFPDDPQATAALLNTAHNTTELLLTGDWVVKGVTGLVFQVPADEFAERYEPVPVVALGVPRLTSPEMPDAERAS